MADREPNMSMNPSDGGSIESILIENRVFEPPADFAQRAHIGGLDDYQRLHDRARDDPEGFWAEMAGLLQWDQPWGRVLDWSNAPFAKWFVGGRLNIAANCVTRHAHGPRRDKLALIFEGEPGDRRTLTYGELEDEVARFAGVLRGLGAQPGDTIAIYMPMVPEAAIAMLACARVGAVHTVVFGGFSADALAGRIQDCGARFLITADGGHRRGKVVPLKENADGAADQCPTIEKVVVLRRTGHDVPMKPGRDLWWHDLAAAATPDGPPQPFDSEHPLFILYTSGSTGKPKGIAHTTGGYLLGAALTTRWVFDLKDDDIYWCTADVGWITGHSYVVYGPLALGATVVLYEGAPNWPDEARFWKIIEDHKVTILYTAPTAIRAFMKWGDAFPKRHDLSSLRLLGTVGEPINPEAWMWYRHVIGGDRCPIVDTWWQTETGAIMIAPLPGATPTRPGSATRPLPGVQAAIVDRDGQPVPDGSGGYLVITQPWPSMLRTIHGDDARFKQQYWSEIPGSYFTGDGARRDAMGNYWIMGRVDDVLNVAGHRLSTMEVESALVAHEAVAEAAVVGKPDDLRGQAIVAFVTLESGRAPTETLRQELREWVVKEIGALARPESIRFTESLPKTRSGKIMRRLLRDVAAGRESTGDTSTIEDFSVLSRLKESDES
jgi:acetyl-CoA synthetase